MPSLQNLQSLFSFGIFSHLLLLEFSYCKYLLDSKDLESSHQCIKLQFKRILQDQFIQSWFSDMNKSSRGQFSRKPCNLKSFVLLLIFSCKIVNLTFSISAQFSKPQSSQEYVGIGNINYFLP
jgi:hypothetical protein